MAIQNEALRVIGTVRLILKILFSSLSHCLERVVDLIFPHCCVACQVDMSHTGFCSECCSRILDETRECVFCGAVIPVFADRSKHCVECRKDRWWIDRTIRLGLHRDLLRDLCLTHKFGRNELIGIKLTELLLQERERELVELDIDSVVPVPMHWLRRMQQGSNHAETISRTIAKRLSIPHAPQILVRRRRTRPQRRLSKRSRARNVRGLFSIRNNADVRKKRVLLVDDILTTGATANEAARVLRRAGASFVAVAVLARRDRPGRLQAPSQRRSQ